MQPYVVRIEFMNGMLFLFNGRLLTQMSILIQAQLQPERTSFEIHRTMNIYDVSLKTMTVLIATLCTGIPLTDHYYVFQNHTAIILPITPR